MIQDLSTRISVVIPHLNQPDFLSRCLGSLAAMRVQPSEIIVVDNGSKTSPLEVCNEFPGVTLLQETTPGPGPARNFGLAHVTGDIVAFIDADCLAHPDWLSAACSSLEDPNMVILGGDVRIARTDPNRMTALEAYESVYAYRMDRYIAREGFTGTGNLVVRRPVLDEVGPFAGLDVAEDRDWGQRATRAGYRITYVADMIVYHPARQTFAELRTKWDRHTAHDFVAAKQRRIGKSRFLLKTLAMGISPLVEIPRLLMSNRIDGSRNRMRAFACLCRIRLYRAKIMFGLLMGADSDVLSGQWNRAERDVTDS